MEATVGFAKVCVESDKGGLKFSYKFDFQFQVDTVFIFHFLLD